MRGCCGCLSASRKYIRLPRLSIKVYLYIPGNSGVGVGFCLFSFLTDLVARRAGQQPMVPVTHQSPRAELASPAADRRNQQKYRGDSRLYGGKRKYHTPPALSYISNRMNSGPWGRGGSITSRVPVSPSEVVIALLPPRRYILHCRFLRRRRPRVLYVLPRQ